ncbi:MAG: DUF4080 domain-containing protein [Ruminococcaceae bacterium]|nr:DUF4080 domain-containing protein [Oscillospiraceae bacterium]
MICLFALNSSYSHTNPAVRCIKKSLRTAGFDAGILEFGLKDKRRRILSALVAADAEIYGFSAYIWNIGELYSLAADLKKLRPASRIVFGGPEVSFDAPEILAAHPYIDHIITGEGEAAWVTLAEDFTAGRTIPQILDGGMFYGFSAQGMVYDETDAHARMVYYESSRGCPFRCAYCLSALSGSVRAKDADVTLAELAEFEKMTGIRVVKFVDRTFNFDRERAKKIWRGLLSEAFTKSYHFEICAELLDEESFAILAKFPPGKVQLEIGVQSSDPAVLARVNRRSDMDKLLENLTRLHRLGNMHIHADIIAGLPGEDFAGVGRTFDALIDRCHMLQLGFLKLLRGSVLRDRAAAYHYRYSDEPPYEVLETDALTYEELCRLHDIDELCDRIHNSGAFSRALAVITAREASPFRMFCQLASEFAADGIAVSELSQPNLYARLYEYLHDGEDVPLAEALTLDFLTHCMHNPPNFGGIGLERLTDDTRRRFLNFAADAGIDTFAPALEVRRGSGIFVIDRKCGRAFRETVGGFVEI